MKPLVEYIASSLVDDPAEVRVREVSSPRETRLTLSVAPEEVGRIIGRQGRTIRAIRTLLDVAGRKAGRRIVLEVEE